MATDLAPEVRLQFARRLKDMRTQRGFDRARYFAKSLGIEENRYTRYERAEVEPNLTLIFEICQKLAVTPNELMGYAEAGEAPRAPGLGDAPPALRADLRPAGAAGPDLRGLAWQLATEAAHVKAELRGNSRAAADPLRLVRDTGRLYSRLEQDPFGTVAEIVDDPALQDGDGERKVKLAALIEAYTAGMSE